MITASPFKDREMYLKMDIKLVSMAGFKAGSKELKQHRKSILLNEKGEFLDKKQLRWSRSMRKCEFVIIKELLYWGINHYIYIYIYSHTARPKKLSI